MKISNKKREKICEQILALLYSKSPQALFTSQIAQEIARDEEFIKKLLIELKDKEFVIKINRNSKGKQYLLRSRWRLSDKIYSTYRSHQ